MFNITNNKWWLSNENDLKDDVFGVVNHLDKAQGYRAVDNLRYARMYSNSFAKGLGVRSYSSQDEAVGAGHKVSLNVIQSLIDTVVSKITKNKVRAKFLTDGATWSMQTKAKKLTKFIDGIFDSVSMYKKAALAFLDAAIFGTGALKIFSSNGEIKVERVFINEIKVSDTESFYGEPRQLHQEKHIHKDVLKQMFPGKKLLIDQATDSRDQYDYSTPIQHEDDMIRVVESWHLRSGVKAKDGVHSIVINNVTLLKEEYTKDFFPFVFFRWNLRPVGFFGFGLGEQLQGLQLEINKILRTIQVSMHLVSVPKLLVEASSKIVSAHLNNKIGGIIKYAGTPPQYSALGQIPSELFSHLEFLYQKAYEISGISQLSAQSLKPSGLDSGKALREYSDIESERFLAVATRYESAFIDAAKIIVSLAKDLYSENKHYEVKVKGKEFIETIKWKDVDLEEDQFMMSTFPTNALSRDPAGRLQDIQELMSAGFLSKEDGLKLLDFPDLNSVSNMLNADAQNLDKIIENMVDEGKYMPPEPYQNLENAVRKVQQAYLMYSMREAPEERLELLRRYMEDAQGLLMKSQEVTPTAAQLTEQLANQGAQGASESVAEQSMLGAQPLNPIIEGGIMLGDNVAPVSPEEQAIMDQQMAMAENEAALNAEQELTDEELQAAQQLPIE